MVLRGKMADRIFLSQGVKVMLDADLAELYGVTTKDLNQAVTRNEQRFPPDFMFRLTKEEKQELVTNCDR
ncbi:MAG: ORF6N domain-containing protein [Deltaproteobacteria bacterium]|nr:ORF6N domain-containing protein [Deltaproteobacteria bacterium]